MTGMAVAHMPPQAGSPRSGSDADGSAGPRSPGSPPAIPPNLGDSTRNYPGLAMPLIGAALMVLSPLVDFGLGLLGIVDDALDAGSWDTFGAIGGAVVFMAGLDLLVVGLIRHRRRDTSRSEFRALARSAVPPEQGPVPCSGADRAASGTS